MGLSLVELSERADLVRQGVLVLSITADYLTSKPCCGRCANIERWEGVYK
jgi:hypothetical protein